MYLVLKALHVLLVTLFLGAGLGSVYYKVTADRAGDAVVVHATMRALVRADLLFTVPSVVGLPVTGLVMIALDDRLSLTTPWIALSVAMYFLAGAPWLYALRLQYDMLALAERAAVEGAPLPAEYRRKTAQWKGLGIVSFSFSVAIVFLMVYQWVPGM